ncbi:hypothetical protein Tco_1480854 [Tanacetum coccineum]
MSTQVYMKKVIEDVGEDEDFKSGSWVSATNYVNANGGIMSGCLGDIKNFLKNEKLNQVVAIAKSCSPNVIGDLTMTLKDLSDEEALNLTLDEEARQARAEWSSYRNKGKKKSWLRNKRDDYEDSMEHFKLYHLSWFLRDQYASLRMINSKSQRLIAELEALGERRDAVRTHVGIGLKDSYVADMEENE